MFPTYDTSEPEAESAVEVPNVVSLLARPSMSLKRVTKSEMMLFEVLVAAAALVEDVEATFARVVEAEETFASATATIGEAVAEAVTEVEVDEGAVEVDVAFAAWPAA